jgi:3-hydroxyisobutyrate dehydrogenase-like beta-hydroxyacid dehydrogenase
MPGSVTRLTTIGFVGLGAMGSRVVGRLLDAGHEVHGTNRTMTRAQPLIARGMQWRETPRETAGAADVVFSMVSDDAALEDITSGQDGILAGLEHGKIYVDMSTVSPRVSRQVHEVGADMLDAPVSGSIPQVEAGTLTIMVGGDQEAFAAVEPLLHELGQAVTRVGTNGQGLLLKLAINISLAVQTLAFSEGLLLAERGGIDSRLAAEVMSASAIGSPMLKARVPMLLDLPSQAWFDVSLMDKDIRLALGAADDLATPIPSAAVAGELLTRAGELGYAHRDIAALHEVLARSSTSPRRPADHDWGAARDGTRDFSDANTWRQM